MNKCFGYIRVSSADQNLDRQVADLKEYQIDDTFEDKVSGKNFRRDGLQSMISQVRSGDTVVVKSLDRLGRSTIDVLTLVQQWADDGIGLTIIDNKSLSFEAGGQLEPSQKLMLSVMASVAELERSLIKERQKEGIAAAKARGVKFGRKKQTSITSKQAKQALIDSDGNKAAAAKALGVNRTTFYRLIA